MISNSDIILSSFFFKQKKLYLFQFFLNKCKIYMQLRSSQKLRASSSIKYTIRHVNTRQANAVELKKNASSKPNTNGCILDMIFTHFKICKSGN